MSSQIQAEIVPESEIASQFKQRQSRTDQYEDVIKHVRLLLPRRKDGPPRCLRIRIPKGREVTSFRKCVMFAIKKANITPPPKHRIASRVTASNEYLVLFWKKVKG